MCNPKGTPINGMVGLGFCDNWLYTPDSLILVLSTKIVLSTSKYSPSGTCFTALQEYKRPINTINNDIFAR